MGMMFSNPFKKKEVDYDELEGAALEAGRAALKGEVSVTKDYDSRMEADRTRACCTRKRRRVKGSFKGVCIPLEYYGAPTTVRLYFCESCLSLVPPRV